MTSNLLFVSLRRVWLLPALFSVLLPAMAQQDKTAPTNRGNVSSSSGTPTQPEYKPPAIIDPAGPQIGLQTSESLFFGAAALNSCGYDEGLENSDPGRMRVRSEINEALQASPEGQNAHDKLCKFIAEHRLSDSSHDLAQYVSLALYLSPPPALTTEVTGSDLPQE